MGPRTTSSALIHHVILTRTKLPRAESQRCDPQSRSRLRDLFHTCCALEARAQAPTINLECEMPLCDKPTSSLSSYASDISPT